MIGFFVSVFVVVTIIGILAALGRLIWIAFAAERIYWVEPEDDIGSYFDTRREAVAYAHDLFDRYARTGEPYPIRICQMVVTKDTTVYDTLDLGEDHAEM